MYIFIYDTVCCIYYANIFVTFIYTYFSYYLYKAGLYTVDGLVDIITFLVDF